MIERLLDVWFCGSWGGQEVIYDRKITGRARIKKFGGCVGKGDFAFQRELKTEWTKWEARLVKALSRTYRKRDVTVRIDRENRCLWANIEWQDDSCYEPFRKPRFTVYLLLITSFPRLSAAVRGSLGLLWSLPAKNNCVVWEKAFDDRLACVQRRDSRESWEDHLDSATGLVSSCAD